MPPEPPDKAEIATISSASLSIPESNGNSGVDVPDAHSTNKSIGSKGSGEEPSFPVLHNNADSGGDASSSSKAPQAHVSHDDEDNEDYDEPVVTKPFFRHQSPDPSARTNGRKKHSDRYDGASTADRSNGKAPARKWLVPKMHKFSLYETANHYYIVGGDMPEARYRILKIDRQSAASGDLGLTDDKVVYAQEEINELLDTIDEANKGFGGIKLRCTTWGLLGFVKFTGAYYMLLITKKSTVAVIGGHYIYQIEGTELIPLTPARYKADQRNAEETRFLGILNHLDLTRSFYFSYQYDITRTLQHNITKERISLLEGRPRSCDDDINSMFVWNTHLLKPAMDALKSPFDWCRPIIHGYVDQIGLNMYSRTAYITVIARRSRHFAGARFLKRGANDQGYVANDVETEQIVSEATTSSFHAPGPKLFTNPTYTSYVQHRGSIPLYWTQDNTGVTPKPPIELNLVDPFYGAAALHFDHLFERYGSPIYALNLVKAQQRTQRESKLLDEFARAIKYLNQFLPEDKKIVHHPWDMSRAAKSRDQDVIGELEKIGEHVVTTTGFFHNGDGKINPIRVQNGVARTNCIDCLDRTNAAQFVIGKRALGYQLHALGILEDTNIDYDTDAVNLFTHMWHDHGDTIAVQYGGSQLVNTMETYRKINQWQSSSRDMIESFKRYYSNSFHDAQRQEAYNLFLGNYTFVHGQPMLWDLPNDHYLHHTGPSGFLAQLERKRDYINWYTPSFLEKRTLPPWQPPNPNTPAAAILQSSMDDYWLEYYRPAYLSVFSKMFPYKMKSTLKYIPTKHTQDGGYDLSPFRVRIDGDPDGVAANRKAKKEVAIALPQHDFSRLVPGGAGTAADDDTASIMSSRTGEGLRGLKGWLAPSSSTGSGLSTGLKEYDTSLAAATAAAIATELETGEGKARQTSLEKARAAQSSFTQLVENSLNPNVSGVETGDYARYISHPQTLPLVVSAEEPGAWDEEYADYQAFVAGTWGWSQDKSLGQAVGAGMGLDKGLSSLSSSLLPGEGGVMGMGSEEEVAAYAELLRVNESPLTVTEDDALKKRYKAYQKWLRGKSLFKQQPVD